MTNNASGSFGPEGQENRNGFQQARNQSLPLPQLKILEKRTLEGMPEGSWIPLGRRGQQYGSNSQQLEKENALPPPVFRDMLKPIPPEKNLIRKRRGHLEVLSGKRSRTLSDDMERFSDGDSQENSVHGQQAQPGVVGQSPQTFMQANHPSGNALGPSNNGTSPIEMLKRMVTSNEASGADMHGQPSQQGQNLQWGSQSNGQQVQEQNYFQGGANNQFGGNYAQGQQIPMFGQHPMPGHNPYHSMMGQYAGPTRVHLQLWQPFLFETSGRPNFDPNQPQPMHYNGVEGHFSNGVQPGSPRPDLNGWSEFWQPHFLNPNANVSAWWSR